MSRPTRAPIIRFRPSDDAAVRLFCFPYAGAGASVYRLWPSDLGARVDVCAIQPPGREARFSDPPFRRVALLVDELARAIVPLLDRPFAFFGHSLGSLVSFELCRRLRRDGHPLPAHLFVSGRRAAQWPVREESFHLMSDADLMEELRRYNGAPAEALAHAELMELLLPMLRADFEMHETYVYEEEPPLDIPISAFGGTSDQTVPEDRLDAWRRQTTKGFRIRMMPGDHFYINHARASLVADITADLGRALP